MNRYIYIYIYIYIYVNIIHHTYVYIYICSRAPPCTHRIPVVLTKMSAMTCCARRDSRGRIEGATIVTFDPSR